VTQRASFTWVSWTMFQDRPLLGFGFGQFTDAKRPYLSDRSVPFYLEAIRTQPHHNTFLSILVETGLVGLGLFLAMLTGWGWLGWKLWRNQRLPQIQRAQGLVMLGMLGIYSQPAIFFDLAYSPSDHWVTFFLAGMTVALYAQVTQAEKNSSSDEAAKKNPSLNQGNKATQSEGPRLYLADVSPK
jgi:O-antigen ligase